MSLVLIDGDPIVYSVGFAAQKHEYVVVAENKDGNLRTERFPSKTAIIEWQAGPGADYHILDSEKVVTPEPVSHALHSVKVVIRDIMDATKSSDYRIALTGPGNFREKVAVTVPYKGNRDPLHKPVHYQAIRDYLTQQHDALVTEGIEADDQIGIWKHHNGGVIASIDKDLDQIPGEHYNYRLKTSYCVSKSTARAFLWEQILSGDGTDNIKGAYKIGQKRASELVAQCDPFDSKCLWDIVYTTYALAEKKKGYPYPLGKAEELALENARLVRILQSKDDIYGAETWHPKEL